MKTLFCSIAFSLLIFYANASQVDSTHSSHYASTDTSHAAKKDRKHYLSINATFFLKQFLNFASQNFNVSSSPYILDYRFVPKSSGFRISAGISYNQKKTTIPASQSGTGVDETDNSHVLTISYRLGYVYQKKIAKKWTIIAGAEFIGTVLDSTQTVTTSSDISSNKAKGWTIGLGPSLGIQFDINKRMGLYTETAFYYTYGSETVKNTFNSFPASNGNIATSSNGLNFILPVSIFYYIKF